MIRSRLTLAFLLTLGLVIAGQIAFAHHSETAEYDNTKPVKITGTLVKVEWANPHVWFFVETKAADGKTEVWGFSTQPPGALMRRGVTKDLMKVGSVVNVEGNRARDGSTNASTRRLTYADGRNVLEPPQQAGGGQ